MQIKYGTDEYGNVWQNFAQIEPVGGTACYNPLKETLDEPIIPDEGKRLIVENGRWEQIDIEIENIKVIENDREYIRPKNQIERYQTGIDIIPKGMKIEEKQLVPKTLDEQLLSGEITNNEYQTIKLNECYILRKQAYREESDGLFFDYQRGEIEKDVWLKKVEEIKEKYPKF